MGLFLLNEEMKRVGALKKLLIEEFSVAWNDTSKFLFKFKDNLEELKRTDLTRARDHDFMEENYFDLFRAVIIKDQVVIETIKSLNKSVIFGTILKDFSLLESLYDLINRGEMSLNAINRGTITEDEYALTFTYMTEIFQTCNKLLELLNVVEQLLEYANRREPPIGDFAPLDFFITAASDGPCSMAQLKSFLDLIKNIFETSARSLRLDLEEHQPIIAEVSADPLGISLFGHPELVSRMRRALIELRKGSYERVEYRLGVFLNVAQAVNDGLMDKESGETYKKRIFDLAREFLGRKIRLDGTEFPLGSPPEELMADALED
jgi:hypothetical protein